MELYKKDQKLEKKNLKGFYFYFYFYFMNNLIRNNKSFTIVITSFEVAIKDHKHLTKYKWKYIVVDEGHRYIFF